MKHIILTLLLLTGMILALPAVEEEKVQAEGTQLTITITGIRPDKGGNLILGIYRGESGWNDFDNVIRLESYPVTGKLMQLDLLGLEPGEDYAFQIFHDENSNGKLDLKKFPPMPDEGVGTSNDHYRWGPPHFRKARFSLISGETIFQKLKLRY